VKLYLQWLQLLLMTAFHDENVFIANIDETSVQKHCLHGWLVVLSLPFELLPFELVVLLPRRKI